MTLKPKHIEAIRAAYDRAKAQADHHQDKTGFHYPMHHRAQGQAEAYLALLDLIDRDDPHMLAVAATGRIDARFCTDGPRYGGGAIS